MTSTINALFPSGPPEQKSAIAAKESPPLKDGPDTRFKDSLDKAMKSGDPAEAEVRSGTPSEEVSSRKKSETDGLSEKQALSEDKKALKLVKDKAELKDDEEVSAVSENSSASDELAGLLNTGESGEKKSEKKDTEHSENRLLIKKGKKEQSAANLQQILNENAEDGIEAAHLNEAHLKSSDNSIKRKETGEEASAVREDQIIPFPEAVNNGAVQGANSTANLSVDKGLAKVSDPASSKKKAKDQPVLTVVDTRSKSSENKESAQAVTKTATAVETADQTSKDNNQIVLGEQNTEKAAADDSRSFESRFTQNREVMLARELRDSGNEQIVKKASFILKDSNQGEIKLILKPEALGRVKIHLDMNENNLVGKIIVENNRVGQIFENNLNNLSKAFEEAGISSSSLEVTVGDGNGQQGNERSYQDDQPFYSERLKTLDQAVPTVERMASGQSSQHINLVV